MTIDQFRQHKSAGIYTDILKNNLTTGLLGRTLGPTVDVVGGLAGAAMDDTSKLKDNGWSWLPGASSARLGFMRRNMHKDYGASNDKSKSMEASETFGAIPSSLLGAVAGAAVGGVANGRSGAAIGGLAGGLAPIVLAAALAGLTPTRTKAEQREYSSNGNAAVNWLVPGAAVYNRYKTNGRLHKDQVIAEDAAEDKEDKEDKD